MTTSTIPKAEPERRWFLEGASREAQLRDLVKSQPAGELYSFVRVVAERGDSPAEVLRYTAVVFTSTWSRVAVLRLCWDLVKPRRSRRRWRIYLDRRDLWVGYFRGDSHHHVCLLPCVVIRWPRGPRR